MVQETEFLETFDGDLIEKQDYIDMLIALYQNAAYNGMTKITDFNVGSEAYHLIDVMAGLLLEYREYIDDNYLCSMIHTCEGEFLDNFGDLRGIYRRNSSPSTGIVRFYINSTKLTNEEVIAEQGEQATEEIIIPEDTVLSTSDSISFITTEEVKFETGQYYVDCEVLCEYEGAYTNVSAESITLILDDLTNAKIRVLNPESLTEGEDIESDDEYRMRILDAPNSHPTGSLNWFQEIAFVDENVASCIHDIKASKQGLNVDDDYDLKLIFNPINKNEEAIVCSGMTDLSDYTVTPSECRLRQFFAIDEYNIVGINLTYEKATVKWVFADISTTISGITYNIDYNIYINIDQTNYPEATLETVTPKIQEVVSTMNYDAEIGIAFSPNTLAVLVEEIDEISDAVIYQRAVDASDSSNVKWGIVSDDIEIPYNCVFQISSDVNIIDRGPDTGLIIDPSTTDEE